MVCSDEPELHWTDVFGSEYEVGTPASEEEVENKKSLPKRVTNSPPTAVLESWLLSILNCKFLVRSVSNFPSNCS